MESTPRPTADDAIRRAIEHRREYRLLGDRLADLRRMIGEDDLVLNAIWEVNANALHAPHAAVERFGSVIRRMPSGVGYELLECVDSQDLGLPDPVAPVGLSPIEREVMERPEVIAQCGGPQRRAYP